MCRVLATSGLGWQRSTVWGVGLAVSVGLVLLGAGCRVVRTTAEIPGQALRAVTPGKQDKPAVDPVEAQAKLLRFADEFSAQVIGQIEALRRGTNTLGPAEILKWKLVFASEVSTIASGPNAIANLLDMTVFITLARESTEDYWLSRVYGESARPLLELCRRSETEVWKLAATVLAPEQQTELRKAIDAWHQRHPNPENLLGARAVGLAAQLTQPDTTSDGSKPASVFDLLRLDPLAGMDPAVRELAQTRLFAERALYVVQWMPTLLRWQTELLALNAVAMPEVQQLVTNSTQLTESVDRFTQVAEKLPAQVSKERQEIIKALESQEKQLTPLVNEVRQTLTAGSQMSTSLNTTIATFDALMKRFGVGEPSQGGPPDTNSEPFRIQDYGQTAVQLEAAARQLTELLRTFDQTLGSTNLTKLAAQVGPAVQEAQTGGKEIVDYAFWKGLLLVAMVLAAVLIYRIVSTRLTLTLKSKSSST
jgi:hypothetical protein